MDKLRETCVSWQQQQADWDDQVHQLTEKLRKAENSVLQANEKLRKAETDEKPVKPDVNDKDAEMKAESEQSVDSGLVMCLST